MSSNIMRRESLLINEGAEIITLPLLAIAGQICFRCLQPSKKLTKCGSCKRATYCSKECQKIDWYVVHKEHCKLLKQINAIEEKELAPSRTWELYQESLYGKVQYLKGLSDDHIVRDIVQAQPYCQTCHRSSVNASLYPGTVLRPCRVCQLVFNCDTCGPASSHTEEECEKYQYLRELEIFKIDNFEQSGQATCRAPTEQPRTLHRPLSSAANWLEYYTQISDKAMIKPFVQPEFDIDDAALKALGPQDMQDQLRQLWLSLTFATETATIALTILAGLEDSFPDLSTKQNISIHMVGAAGKEVANLMLLEEILHLLPSLKHLKVALVGPKCGTKLPDGNYVQNGDPSQEMPMGCCAKCSSTGRTRSLTTFQGVYHDYAKTKYFKRPDLAVLFHSGRSQEAKEQWKPTTTFLVESDILTLCTTYNATEAKEEVAELDYLGAALIIRPEINKWRSLVPVLEYLDGPKHMIYYHNYYRYIFQGRRSNNSGVEAVEAVPLATLGE